MVRKPLLPTLSHAGIHEETAGFTWIHTERNAFTGLGGGESVLARKALVLTGRIRGRIAWVGEALSSGHADSQADSLTDSHADSQAFSPGEAQHTVEDGRDGWGKGYGYENGYG